MVCIHEAPQRTKGPAEGKRFGVRAIGKRCRTTLHRASGVLHPILLNRCYDVDVHTISGKPVVPLRCQKFEIGENTDWEFVYQNSNNGYLVAAGSEVSTSRRRINTGGRAASMRGCLVSGEDRRDSPLQRKSYRCQRGDLITSKPSEQDVLIGRYEVDWYHSTWRQIVGGNTG